ncbi:MAG: 7-carboxy-7-deazaguanine synthase QueE [Marinilabiliales bacterium]
MKKKFNNNSSEGTILPLIDQFYTLQGEGFHAGKAAYFIRIGGCDIGCNWCDTKISWNPDFHNEVSVEEILKNIKSNNADSIVVTGGEPSMYNLDYLCKVMKSNNIKTFIETSGNHLLTGDWDWICLSPKTANPPLIENFLIANELKVIISEKKDFEWAEKCKKQVNQDCKLFLQPEWSNRKSITPVIVQYIKEKKDWNLSVQLHKYLGIQ